MFCEASRAGRKRGALRGPDWGRRTGDALAGPQTRGEGGLDIHLIQPNGTSLTLKDVPVL